ncbi:tether containing ubx domain for glut4 [Acrodontium crateriforme]|uniref:Tether containing ubx domain for glut4 n=1 Tax=Acrodontium crateriforme TaxID=150365 RepID=A0AAQ3R6U8_9PEZI|nr:tether containing ubx domain for glut4 [Acrodontium crateriforme]
MSSTVFVVDSSFKRTQIKVTPGKYLREILEEACKAKKVNPEAYTLKTQTNKVLDLSQPFRLSGLSAGAKLQLVQASRSPSVVSIALQLPESEGGGRVQDKFPSNTSLWLVLRKFEDGVAGSLKKLNLTQRGVPSGNSGSGRLLYEQPCINLMSRTLDTFTDLQKTLAQLGINSGNAMMRLNFRLSEQPLEIAMQEISQYFGAHDAEQAAATNSMVKTADEAHSGADGGLASIPSVDAADAGVPSNDVACPEPDNDISMKEAPTAPTIENDVIASSSVPEPEKQNSEPANNVVNGISVFLPPSSSTPAAALQPDDPAVFEPTIDHAKAHQAALQRSSKNTRLLSDAELEEQERERREKLALVQQVTIRVRYPDQSMIETTLQASDTAADLYSRVNSTLACAHEAFELRYTGSKGHETLPNNSSKRLVRDLGFRGKVLVTMVWDTDASTQAKTSPCLKEEYRSKATDLKVELASQQADSDAADNVVVNKKSTEPKKEASKGDLEAKMKKFLGFGKK